MDNSSAFGEEWESGLSFLYQNLFEHSYDGIMLAAPDGKIFKANPAATEILGYSEEEIIALGRDRLIDLADPDLPAMLEERARTGRVKGELTFIGKGGRRVATEFYSQIYQGENGKVYSSVIFRDITERKAAEAELRASEEKYRCLVESADSAISLIAHNGTYLYLNQIAAAYLGLSPEQLIGKSIFQLVPAHLSAPLMLDINRVIAENKGKVLESQVKVGEKQLWFRTSIQPVRDGTGQPYAALVLSTDLTQSREAEKALRESQIQFQQFMQNLPGAIFIRGEDGRTVYCNEAYARLAGKIPADLIGKHSYEYFPAEIAGQFEKGNGRVLAGGKVMEFQHTFPGPEGPTHWLTVKFPIPRENQPPLLGAISLDITRERRAEEALRESEQRYRQLFEAHGLPELIIDPQSWQIVDANVAAGKFFGYKLTVLKGMRILDFIPTSATSLRESIRQEEQLRSFEVVQRVAGGDLRNVEVFTGPVEIEGKRFLFSIITDVTEKHRAQAELKEAYALLEQRVVERTAELEKVKNRLEAIFNHSGDGVLMLDREQGIQQANYTFEQLFEVEPEEYTGKRLEELLQPEDRISFEAAIREVAATHQKCQVETSIRNSGTRVEISLAPVNRSDRAVTNLVGIIRDITGRKEAEQALRNSEEKYRKLYAAAQRQTMEMELLDRVRTATLRELDLSGVIRTVIEEIVNTFGYTQVSLYLLENSDTLALQYQVGYSTSIKHIPVTKGVTGRVVRTGQPVFLKDVREDPSFLGAIDGVNSEVCVPLLENGRVAGVLNVESIKGVALTEDDLRLMIALSQYVNLAITRARLFSEARENAKKYRLVIESVREVIFQTDVAGKWNILNPAWSELTGYSIEESLGEFLLDYILPDDRQYAANFIYPLLERKMNFCRQEVRFLTRGGHICWFDMHAHVTMDNNGRGIGISGILVDITERKQAEETLRESEERYRLLAENISDVIIKLSPDDRHIFVSPSSLDLLGYTPAELIGRLGYELIHPDDLERSQAIFRRAIESGATTFSFTNRALHKDGHFIWVELNNTIVRDARSGEPVETICILHDITERKRTEDELVALSRRLQLATEAGGIGTWEWDAQKDELFWDDQLLNFYGISREEFKGSLAGYWGANLIYAGDRERVAKELNEALVGIKPLDTEFRINVSDGGIRYLKARCAILRDDKGLPTFVVGINWDITLIKEAEENLKRALEIEKELGELKSRFVSMTSHEFRTPLAAILATTEALLSYRSRMEQTQIDTRLEKIKQQVLYLKNIMDEVLQLSRIQAGKVEFKPVRGDLNALCLEIIEEFESQGIHQGRIAYACAFLPVWWEFDLNLMRGVVNNLISNALKYSGQEKEIEVELSQSNGEICLRVKDQGIGIPEADLKHLFEPFHRAENVGTIGGTGLGLLITRQSIELHGGRLVVESQENIGTTMTMVIPEQGRDTRDKAEQESVDLW